MSSFCWNRLLKASRAQDELLKVAYDPIMARLGAFKNELPAFRNGFWPAALDSLENRAAMVLQKLIPRLEQKADLQAVQALCDGLGQCGLSQSLREKVLSLDSSSNWQGLVDAMKAASATPDASRCHMFSSLLHAMRAYANDDDVAYSVCEGINQEASLLLPQAVEVWKNEMCKIPLEENKQMQADAEGLIMNLVRIEGVAAILRIGSEALLAEAKAFVAITEEVLSAKLHL